MAASDVRIGFVALLDAAPLIAAMTLGYFADEGLRVTLERQIGWGNVRDKLVYGHLHASHALVGMPPVSVLGRDRFPAPVTAIMGLGAGGNAITLGRRLTDMGIDSAVELARAARLRGVSNPILLAHVFGCSMHHYLLRDWLAAGGIDPDRDVRLCVLPPPQTAGQMEKGCLDGFCSGEPWNTVAERQGLGKIVAVTADLIPDHPEKVVAVSGRWLAKSPDQADALVRATLRGCVFCTEKANAPALAEMLAAPAYLDMPAELLLRSLTIDRWFGGAARRGAGPIRNCAPATTFPSATHAAWLLKQMIRWGHLPPDIDVVAVARLAVDSGPYRRVAEGLKLECPPDDLPPMKLRTGWFDARLLVRSDCSQANENCQPAIAQ
ncbi:MAG TPA: CmpA/NrtA family ABC transporter substrate-binding protein [Tepidisphaeraceae bacterium]|nr:CmpA/NrtA family ABC transporter substrate-binding protein [Tepidisphaeraceae bacterium]